MTIAALEYTRIDTWTMASAPGSVSIPMTGPTGTKPLVTLAISGVGIGGSQSSPQFTNVRFTSAAFSSIGCTWTGRMLQGTNQFVELWKVNNVPIGGASTTYLEFDWEGTCSGPCPFGGVETAFWNGTTAFSSNNASGTGTTGSISLSAIGADKVRYGMMMGGSVSDWHLAGATEMETIYPNHATTPPEFTNSHSVLVGAPTQTGAPKVCCGFMAGPTTVSKTFSFSFGASTAWRVFILEITAASLAVPSQLVTILG